MIRRYKRTGTTLAERMNGPFQISAPGGQILQGSTGDYRCTHDPPEVVDGVIDCWIVKRKVFEKTYTLAEETEPVTDDTGDVTGFTVSQLDVMKKRQLQDLAAERGIDARGMNKAALVTALLDTNNPVAQ